MFAVGVKLRRVGPIAFASAAYCIVEPRRSRGEKRLQLQVVVTRPWCGPRGYIQVGMRGCLGGGRAGAVRRSGRSPS